MENILTAATVIAAVVLGVTQLIKQVIDDNKYLPVVNIVIGIVIGVVYAVTIVKGDIAVYAWAGLIAGLAAGGFYDFGSKGKDLLVNINNKPKPVDRSDLDEETTNHYKNFGDK